MTLSPIQRTSLPDAVFDQLADSIVSGGLAPGESLPAERDLAVSLGVNRNALREALRRLNAARLVETRHGGGSTVLDYREHAGLDLVPRLLLRPDGSLDVAVARSIVEMRAAIGADAARLAALRGDPLSLEPVLEAMARCDGDLGPLPRLAMEFWQGVVEASGNLAYRLAFNSLRSTYDPIRDLLAGALADELRDLAGYRLIVAAIAARSPDAAEAAARAVLSRGARAMLALLHETEEEAPR